MEPAAFAREVPAGTMLDEKYRVERLLATGGMGAVYLATHVALRKRVAIKILNPQLSSKRMVERFHREAITASQIGHEGIAQVTDLGSTPEGEPFLVMEYLEGESLGARLLASGPLPIEQACEIGCSILAPLAAAHQAGIVHRDLKPDNVFLVRRSRGEMVKLLDFGISRSAGVGHELRLTKTGLVLGTPYYMSPEQARGDDDITPASDLYAFGVILYEMLIGRVPIEGDNYNQLMYRVLTGDFQRPRALRPELPEPLEQIILAAMAMDPAARPASALELEQQLLAFCRPAFRDHQLDRLSSSSMLPLMTATPPAGVAPLAVQPDTLVEAARAAATEEEPASPTAQTVLAAPSQIEADEAVEPPRRRRIGRAAGALAVVAAVAAVTVVVAIGRRGPGEPRASAASAALPEPVAAPAAPAPAAVPAAAPVTAPGPAPAAPSTVTLRFTVEPPNAVITLDGAIVADQQITVPRDGAAHKLRISAPGHVTHDEVVHFDETQKLVVRLARAGRPASAGGGRARVRRQVERIESKSPYAP